MLTLFDLVGYLDRGGEALARRVKLTTREWLVLLHIAGDPNFPGAARRKGDTEQGVLPSDIAAARGVSRAHISVLVASLLERELVRHVHDAGDARRRRLAVTAEGWRAIEAVEPVRHLANRRLFATMTAAERRTLLHQLRDCLAFVRHERAVVMSAPPPETPAPRRRSGGRRTKPA